jgi:manganese/zinc/iron transport system substrate-binding protein
MKNILPFLIALLLLGCNDQSEKSKKLRIVTTTTMITDLVKNIGGDYVEINGLMGAGVDPHLYKASEGDVTKLFEADIIFYSGLHLEGKLVAVFEKMEGTKHTVSLGDRLPENELISSENFASSFDPHVWFNIQFFKQFAQIVTDELSKADPKNAESYSENNKIYQKKN